MWNLRANSEVLDDTWWEKGGNALWSRYARNDNINRETVTMFLTDEEWADFEAIAKTLPGWKGIDPYPVDNPLWVVRQNILFHICNDPWVWLQATIGEARRRSYEIWLDGTDQQRAQMTAICHKALDDAIKAETKRWELFGIVPRLEKRMVGIERCTPEWTEEYTKQFFHCYRSICFKAKTDFTNRFYNYFEPQILAYLEKYHSPNEEDEADFGPSAYLFPDDQEYNDTKEEQEAHDFAEEDDDDDDTDNNADNNTDKDTKPDK